ncbi:Signal transduction histidine kinase [Rhodospirillales bacterium URHD0017]|nr:Signal transduction histidine kinase [Rhodospirillales bacterium URHD0017]
MHRRRVGVRTALTAWYLLVLSLVIAAFSAALYWDQEQTLSAQVDRSLAGASGQVLALIDKHVDPITFVEGDAYRHATGHLAQAGYAVLVFDPKRRLLTRFGRALDLPADIGTVDLATIDARVDGVEEPWRVSWQPVVRHDGVTVGYLAVGQSVEAIEQALHGLLLTLAWAAPAALALAGLAGYGLARLAMRPVDRMTQFVRSLGASDLQKRLNDHGPDDELGRLATTLDEMLARLEASFARERRFVADAAHELRTPLAALKSRLDVVRQRERDAEAYRAAIDTIEPEVERLIRLVRDLLLLARLETGSAPWEETPVDLSQLCERIVEQMEPLARERGLSITRDVEPGLLVNGSFDHLLRALINLLDNAIKYAQSPGRILVEGRQADGIIRLRVANDGQALDATVIARVGERFLRSAADRSRETGGVGLGLAIAAEIARHHRGSLSLARKEGGGAVATLNLHAGTVR